jgi:uncharacterized protein YbaR (Trm112 family)
MALPSELLDLLACPQCKQPLVYFPRGEKDDDPGADFLFCPASRLRYRIEDEVPVLLPEEATPLSAADVDRLLARARLLGLTSASHG